MWFKDWGNLRGQLVVVSGPSGSGKSTVLRMALERLDAHVELSVSATTRPRRPGETDRIDYHFLNREEFEKGRAGGQYLEWAEYNGHLYGTPAREVCMALEAGKTLLLEIEVQGALQIRNSAPGSLFVFIRTPRFRDLENRLRKRGTESEEAIHARLRKAREELAEAHWYDVQLVNDELERCVDEFVAVLNDYGCGG
jgi:guanylate kinase